VLASHGPVPAARGSFQGPFTDLVNAGVTSAGIVGITAREKDAEERFNQLLFDTVLTREKTAVPKAGRRSSRDHLATLPSAVVPERLEWVYVATLPLRASNREEFAEALLRVKDKFEVGRRFKKLVVVGDQQT
jgi:hypothetical protein